MIKYKFETREQILEVWIVGGEMLGNAKHFKFFQSTEGA